MVEFYNFFRIFGEVLVIFKRENSEGKEGGWPAALKRMRAREFKRKEACRRSQILGFLKKPRNILEK